MTKADQEDDFTFGWSGGVHVELVAETVDEHDNILVNAGAVDVVCVDEVDLWYPESPHRLHVQLIEAVVCLQVEVAESVINPRHRDLVSNLHCHLEGLDGNSLHDDVEDDGQTEVLVSAQARRQVRLVVL